MFGETAVKLYSFFAMNRAFMAFFSFSFLFFSFLLFSFFIDSCQASKTKNRYIHASWRTRETNKKPIYTMLAFAMELPIMTLFTKFTMAVAGCSGSSSANT